MFVLDQVPYRQDDSLAIFIYAVNIFIRITPPQQMNQGGITHANKSQ